MLTDWIIEQITSINLPTIVVSMGGSWGLRELVDWLKRRDLQTQQADMQKNLQLQKAEIDRELEITKAKCQREMQIDYLQTQLKTASLYKAYPELHWAFKEAEGSVYQLFYHSSGRQDETYKVWCGLTQKLAKHSLFLDEKLRLTCVTAKDALMSAIRSYDSIDTDEAKDVLMSDIHTQVDAVTTLMQAKLLDEETIKNM